MPPPPDLSEDSKPKASLSNGELVAELSVCYTEPLAERQAFRDTPASRRDAWLAERLERLRRQYVAYDDAIAALEALKRLAKHNIKYPDTPYPTPLWLNEFLLRIGDKIGRLYLGVSPDDDRSLDEIGFANVGALRKVRQQDGPKAMKTVRYRDERINHLAAALGFAGKGWNAFRRHDRAERDEELLHAYDADFGNDKASRKTLRKALAKQEGIEPPAFRNRLARARAVRSTKPA